MEKLHIAGMEWMDRKATKEEDAAAVEAVDRWLDLEPELAKAVTSPHLWDAPASELLAAIDEAQETICMKSLEIAFCMSRIRELRRKLI